jgi:uncharacterized membrane protein required for colicin V production
MILILTLVIMLAVAYAQYRNGLFGSCAMLVMVFLAGLVAFDFWEPIADSLDTSFQNATLAGCEDLISLGCLFAGTLFLLRLAVNYFCPDMIAEHGALQHIGAGGVGLITGYFLAGFLICALQTLPLDVHFMDFETRENMESAYRSFYPPDRVWLALMRHAGARPFSWKEDNPDAATFEDRYLTFDRHGTFELRYQRYRRTTEARGPMPYMHEFDTELGRYRSRR